MRNLKGIKWTFMLSLIAGTASADVVIDNQLIPSNDISAISILPSSGQINISTVGYTVTKDGGTTTDPNAVKITNFSASPTTIDEGKSTKVSWSIQNATSCLVTGDLAQINGTVTGTGSLTITIPSSGNYRSTLTCEGSSGPVSRVLTIAVNKLVVIPEVTCPAATLSGTTRSWASFWGKNFPAPTYDQETTSIPRSGYLALEFDTGSTVTNGALMTIDLTRSVGVRLGAISECPGNFNVKPECDRVWGVGGGIGWATDGTKGACQLKPNTKYYFNLTFTDGSSSSTSTCTSIACETVVRHTSR